MPPNVTGIWMAWDYQRTVELALQLQAKTPEVVCVAGAGVQEQLWNNHTFPASLLGNVKITVGKTRKNLGRRHLTSKRN